MEKHQKHEFILGEDALTVDGMNHIYKALSGNDFTAEERSLAQQKLDMRDKEIVDPFSVWERQFRTDAQADGLQAFISHLQRLELMCVPSLLLEGSITFVHACTAALYLDGQPVKTFLDQQGYHKPINHDFEYHATFALGDGVFARVNVSKSLRTLNLADLYDMPWEGYGRVGFNDFWLSRIDGLPLSPSEISAFEGAVERDLRSDFSEGELTFWFDPDTHGGILKVTVQDVDESLNGPCLSGHSGMTEEESALWENDPFAIKKDDRYKRVLMNSIYSRLKDRGIASDSEEAKSYIGLMPLSYADWLKSQGES
jgi:hypothetical protein